MVGRIATAALIALFSPEAETARVRRGASNSTSSWQAVLLPGHIDIKRPAFLFLDEEKDEVLVSQFGKLKKRDQWSINPMAAASSISKIPFADLQNMFAQGSFRGNLLNSKSWIGSGLQWPNKLSRSPAEVGDFVVVPDGFLPPGKSDGNIFLADAAGTIHRISKEVKGAFYHEVEWFDFNGDGLLDMLTARTIKTGPPWRMKWDGELLWYENPGKSSILTQEWPEHVITKGPDVIFKSMHYNGGHAIFTTEFFLSSESDVPKLSVHFVSNSGVKSGSRVIDSTALGKPFAVDIVDVDGDGKKELLVTNHQDNEDAVKPGVFVYEIPDDLEGGEYTRHTITQGISRCKVDDAGVGSPGFANAFYPKVGMTGPKHIITAGDGSFDIWFSKPTGKRFEYETDVIDFDGTTGQLMLHDISGDGIMDVLVPDNDYWKIRGLTFTQR